MAVSLYDVCSLLRRSIPEIINDYRSDKTANTSKHLELEIRMHYPFTKEIGELAAKLLDNMPQAITITSFIEIVYRKPDVKNQKIRIRIPYSNITTMNQTSKGLLELRGPKVMKTTIAEKVIVDNEITLALSSENNVSYGGYIGESTVSFVQLISCRIKSWVIDYKLKHPLNNPTRLCSYILSSYLTPHASLEIEYKDNALNITDKEIMELEQLVFKQLFLTNHSLKHIYINPITLLMKPIFFIEFETMIMEHPKILSDISTLSHYITVKADGVNCMFTISKEMIYIQVGHMWYGYTCSVKGTWYGRGELIEKTRLYPFFVYRENTIRTRQQHLDDFFKDIDTSGDDIQILNKEIRGPFKSREERCAALSDMLSNTSIPNDGCIIYNPDYLIDPSIGSNKITDYKYKINNTIDLLAVVTMNDLAFVGVPGINTSSEDSLKLNFLLFCKDNNNVPIKIGKTTLSKNDTMYSFKVDTSYFVSQLGDGTKIVHFHKMIVEGYIKDNVEQNDSTNTRSKEASSTTSKDNTSNDVTKSDKINFVFKDLRCDKTDKYFIHKKLGNTQSMINHLLQIEATRVDITLLQKLSQHFDDSLFNNASSGNTIGINPDNNDVRILNRDPSKGKSSEYSNNELLVSRQFVKSDIIFKFCSPMLSSLYPPHKPISSVLMIDGGQGIDIRKYHSSGCKYYLVTDKDAGNLLRVTSIFNEIKNNINKTEKGTLGDYKTRNITMLNNQFVTSIKKDMISVDVIDWNTVNEYWTESSKATLLHNLSNISSNGTKLIMTYTDANQLHEELSKKKSIVFQLRNGVEYRYNYIDEFTYRVVTPSKTTDEYYIYGNDLKKAIESIGYKIISSDTSYSLLIQADSFFNSNLHTLEEQESTKRFLSLVNSSRASSNDVVLSMQKMINYIMAIKITK